MNNNNKGEIMNKLTKVGLSALAGSLAVVSANASEYSVTGDTQVVFSSAEGNEAGATSSNGKGYGVDTDIYFTASGETDNGWTVSVFSAMDMEQANTATSGGLNSSAQMTIGMGSLGTVQFNDVSGSAANAIDDVLPKAYEEVWDGTSHGAANHSFGSSTQSGSVDYRTPAFSLMGFDLSATYTYDPNGGAGPASAGGVGGNSNSGEAFTAKVSGMGFTLGGGTEEINQESQATGVHKKQNVLLVTRYTLTVQYQSVTKSSTMITVLLLQELQRQTQKVMVLV